MAMTVSISDDARAGWKAFARSQGVSVTALAESFGSALADFDAADARHTRRLVAIVAEAREIDAERRSRQRDPYAD